MSVFIAEVNQAGHVKEEFNKVVQDEEDQTQTVQARRYKKTIIDYKK